MSNSFLFHNRTTHRAHGEAKQFETCLLPLALKKPKRALRQYLKRNKMGTFLNRCRCVL